MSLVVESAFLLNVLSEDPVPWIVELTMSHWDVLLQTVALAFKHFEGWCICLAVQCFPSLGRLGDPESKVALGAVLNM